VGATRGAERVGGNAARGAATWKEEVDEPRRSRYVGTCNVSVPTL
jgi:hypothetical protein